MKIIRSFPGADEIISKLKYFYNEDGKETSFEISDDDKTDNSIALTDKLRFPAGYGLIYISSKIDKSLLSRKDAVLLGISNYPRKEIESFDKQKTVTMKKISQLGLAECIDLTMENAMAYPKLCISINLDVLDRAFYPRGAIGGMTTRELVYAIQRLKLMRNLKTAEIKGEDAEITAKLVKELIL